MDAPLTFNSVEFIAQSQGQRTASPAKGSKKRSSKDSDKGKDNGKGKEKESDGDKTSVAGRLAGGSCGGLSGSGKGGECVMVRPRLGDRVVNLTSLGVPFGLRGTVVAMHENTG